jgi:phosphatidyl-myo-inositol dimannoside synthase
VWMRPRRILHLIHERIGAIGGIQRFDLRVLRALSALSSELGYELEVLALNGIAPDIDLPEGTRLTSANGGRARLLWLLLKEHWHGLDMVYVAHMRLQKAVWPARLLFFRSRYLLFVHGIESWSAGRTRRNRFMARAIVNFSVDDVVSVSRFTAGKVLAAFALKRQKIHLLPNALDVPPALARSPIARSSHDGNPVILTVARMDKHDMQKGIPPALQAIALLVHEFPGVKYRIIGDGVLRSDHEALARQLGLESQVEFLGRIAESELEGIYDRSDIFLLPSSKEGFGIVFLEAWRHGLPIVCGNVDASPEIVENGVDGFTVDPEDPQAIAQAVRKLLIDPAMRLQFATRGRSKLVAKYSTGPFMDTLRQIVTGERNTQPALNALSDDVG